MTKEIFTEANIQLNITLTDKDEAIRYAGGILVDNGYVAAEYIDKMLEREELTSTYIGNHVAIPHGTEDSQEAVINTGISLTTVPAGIAFGGINIPKVLIGIAGKRHAHLEVHSKLATVWSECDNAQHT